MIVSGRHIAPEAFIIIDGRRAQGMVALGKKEQVEIELESLPAIGMHLLQLQNPSGLFSNDFIFQVHESPAAASAGKASVDPESERRAALRAKLAELVVNGRLTAAESADVFRTTFPEDDPWNAVRNANQNRLQYLVEHGADVNERNHRDGSTLMSAAAFHGQAQIVKYLLDQGADVNASNADGNTPLHVAAFLCRKDIVQLLLDHGASLTAKSHRGETPLDVVRTPWSDDLEAFYRTLGEAGGFETDTAHLRKSRPEILQLLQSQTQK